MDDIRNYQFFSDDISIFARNRSTSERFALLVLARMRASISSASRIGHHCAPALPASTSPHTPARSHKLVFASALLLRFLRIACCACPAPRTNSGAQRVSARLPPP